MVEVEKFKLVAQRMGVDFSQLLETLESCLDDALINLKPTLDKDSEALSKVGEDEEEQR